MVGAVPITSAIPHEAHSATIEWAADALRMIVETDEARAALLGILGTDTEAAEFRIAATVPLLWDRLGQHMETPVTGDVPAIIAALIVTAAASVAEERRLIKVDDALLTTALRILHHIVGAALSGERVDSSTVERVRLEAGHEVSPLIPIARALWWDRCGAQASARSVH